LVAALRWEHGLIVKSIFEKSFNTVLAVLVVTGQSQEGGGWVEPHAR
jgi:hypothetical protein